MKGNLPATVTVECPPDASWQDFWWSVLTDTTQIHHSQSQRGGRVARLADPPGSIASWLEKGMVTEWAAFEEAVGRSILEEMCARMVREIRVDAPPKARQAPSPGPTGPTQTGVSNFI